MRYVIVAVLLLAALGCEPQKVVVPAGGKQPGTKAPKMKVGSPSALRALDGPSAYV